MLDRFSRCPRCTGPLYEKSHTLFYCAPCNKHFRLKKVLEAARSPWIRRGHRSYVG